MALVHTVTGIGQSPRYFETFEDIEVDKPALDVSGMASVYLDREGRLHWLSRCRHNASRRLIPTPLRTSLPIGRCRFGKQGWTSQTSNPYRQLRFSCMRMTRVLRGMGQILRILN